MNNFGWALDRLKAGGRVQREGWNGKGMWLKLVFPHGGYSVNSELKYGAAAERPELLPWIGMKTADNKFVPWLASQTDLLADDWSMAS